MSWKIKKTWMVIGALILAMAALLVTVLLLGRRGNTPESAAPEDSAAVVTETPAATPAPFPPATVFPTEEPALAEEEQVLPDASPTPTPYITPPADVGAPASGSDIILETVPPSTDSDLSVSKGE